MIGQIVNGKYIPGTKICAGCGDEKSEFDFNYNKTSPDGLKNKCKICISAYQKNNHKKRLDEDSDAFWGARIIHLYSMTPDQYTEKLKEQNGVCEICHQFDPTNTRLAIDHCDHTKINRGLLCRNCNMSLGGFDHNPELLRYAASYLEKYHPKPIFSNRYLIGA